MAPEDILRSVDQGRREFLRKLIAGSTFAVPLMASFSMEGLSLDPAEAQDETEITFCPNQPPPPPCCELAEEIAVMTGCLVCCTGVLLSLVAALPTVKAKIFTPLLKALRYMTDGLDLKDDDLEKECVSSHTPNRFKHAKKSLLTYLELLQELCGPNNIVVVRLSGFIGSIMSAIDALLAGDCATGATVIQGLKSRLNRQTPSAP